MHKSVLPLLFGFILLGALGHDAAQRVRGQDADAPAPAPARQANMPKQLRALDDAGALDAPRTGAGVHSRPGRPAHRRLGHLSQRSLRCFTGLPPSY